MNNVVVRRKFAHRGRAPGRARTALTALALVLVALTVVAAPAAAGAQVPFKGRVQGTEVATPIDATHLSVTRTSTGNATHLGRFTAVALFVVDLTPGVGFGIATGTVVFTAANGDTVIADTVGHATPTATPGVLSIAESGIITGGTGRFAGATGSYSGTGLLNGNSSAASFEGTISSPGASKH
jgi:hypothetical protein